MTLIHRPGKHVDRFEHDVMANVGYSVFPHPNPTDPRIITNEHRLAIYVIENSSNTAHTIRAPKARAVRKFRQVHTPGTTMADALREAGKILGSTPNKNLYSLEIRTIHGPDDRNGSPQWANILIALTTPNHKPWPSLDIDAAVEDFRKWLYIPAWTVIADGSYGIKGIHTDTAEQAVQHYRQEYQDITRETTIVHEDDLPPTKQWLNDVPRALADCLVDREEPVWNALADWLHEHENDGILWDAINKFFDDLADLAASPADDN